MYTLSTQRNKKGKMAKAYGTEVDISGIIEKTPTLIFKFVTSKTHNKLLRLCIFILSIYKLKESYFAFLYIIFNEAYLSSIRKKERKVLMHGVYRGAHMPFQCLCLYNGWWYGIFLWHLFCRLKSWFIVNSRHYKTGWLHLLNE